MKFAAIKTVNGYLPTMDDQKVPVGAEVMIEFTRGRNPGNHRRFFSFISAVFDMQDFFENQEVFRKWLLVKAGCYEIVLNPDGSSMLLPNSISFEKMDETEFQDVFSRCIDAFIAELGNGLSRDDILRIVEYG